MEKSEIRKGLSVQFTVTSGLKYGRIVSTDLMDKYYSVHGDDGHLYLLLPEEMEPIKDV